MNLTSDKTLNVTNVTDNIKCYNIIGETDQIMKRLMECQVPIPSLWLNNENVDGKRSLSHC